MKSWTQLQNYFNTYTLTVSPSNDDIADILLNDAHRYLIQQYFDNESTVYLRTAGPQVLTLSSSFGANGAKSATLATAWPYGSSSVLTVFSSGEQRTVNFVTGSTNINWSPPLYGSFDGSVTSASVANNNISFTLEMVGYETSIVENGEGVIFSGASLPGGITAGTTYYLGNVTLTTTESNNTIPFQTVTGTAKLYTDSGLTTPVTIISTGTGTFTSVITTTIYIMGVQAYLLPANVSKIKNATITVGQLVYTPAPVNSIQEWTKLNALPYNSSIPGYFYIYGRQLNFWPIPSDVGDVISLNCQIKVADMTYADYTTGTIQSATVGSNIIVGAGTSWAIQYPTGTDLGPQNLYLIIDPPGGDGMAYKIQSVSDNTHLTLYKDIQYAPNTSGASYSIGQYPLLFDDFHDLIALWALKQYHSSIVKDSEKFQMWNSLLQERFQYMERYLGTKQVNVDLSVTPVLSNPNLYPYVPPTSPSTEV